MTAALAFLGVAALVIVTPGQDTALTIRNTLAGARRGGLLTALGVAGGQACWALATSAGLAALLVASKPVFTALRLAGAAYLVLLGAQALLAALRGRRRHGPAEARPQARRAFRQGLLSNLSNPKMAVFFTSLLPQFASSFLGLLALGLVFSLLTLAWLGGYAVAVARARNVLLGTRAVRIVDAVTGAVLVGLGLRVAAEPR